MKAYIENDFLSAAGTANSGESNGYNPRLRHGYMTVDRDDYGLHFLASQTWSLLTLDKAGIQVQSTQHRFRAHSNALPKPMAGFQFWNARQPIWRIQRTRTQAAMRSTAVVMLYPDLPD